MPNSEEVKSIVSRFEEKSVSLDGTHIPIIAPSSFNTDYYNRKGWYSVLLQGLVDHLYVSGF